MNCQEFEELIGSYALEALSDEERKAADEHLAECHKCTRTAQQLQAIVDLFPLTVPAVDPPPRLQEQILARIQANEIRQATTQQIAQPRRRQNRWQASLLAAVAFLALILIGGLAGWNFSLRQQVANLSNRVSPPIVYAIAGTENNKQASGQVIYYPEQNITVLVMRDLPNLNGTQVYQGWLLRGQKPTSIGLFNVHDGVATLDFQGNLTGYDSAAVSLENGPFATNNAPQGPVVALGALKKA